MFGSLAGKTAIVTGASRGIGRGIAARFARAGIRVVVVSRKRSEAEAVAASIGGEALGFEGDVATAESCRAMVAAAEERFGSVDILCANAGIFTSARIEDMAEEEFDSVLRVNLRSLFLGVKAVIPAMERAGRGRIILTSSITGPVTGIPGWSHYGASKAGQLGFMRTAALELATRNITVNAILPGNIASDGLADLGEEYRQAMERSIPLKRLGDVEDIGNTALFFASEEAGFITGQTLIVDGGQVLPEALDAA